MLTAELDRRQYRRDVYTVVDAPGWLSDLADRAEEALRQANNDLWPLTLRQMRRAAACFHRALRVEAAAPSAYVDGLVVVLPPCRSDLDLLRRAVHELVESAARAGQLGALVAPGALTPHHLACLVEARYALFYRHVAAAEEETEALREERARRRAAPSKELTYEPAD